MERGKIAAQCGHATLGAYRKAIAEKRQKELKGWLHAGQAKIALKCSNEEELYVVFGWFLTNRLAIRNKAREAGILTHCVIDAGRTQIAAGSRTVLALGPGKQFVSHFSNFKPLFHKLITLPATLNYFKAHSK